jgi:hypothetical protein
MAVDARVEVRGLKEALKELNKISPSLRRQFTREYKEIMQPVVKDAQAMIPTKAPLSGMDRAWKTKSGFQILPGKKGGGWNAVAAQKMIKPKINTRKIKEFRGRLENVATLRLVWLGIANSVYDMAGRRSANMMANNLEERFGRASRIVWPAMEKNQDAVMQNVQSLVDKVAELVSRRLQIETRKA